MHRQDCPYLHAACARAELADALASGHHSQIPRQDRLNGTLRTNDNLFSTTGVATLVLTDSIWINTPAGWEPHPLDIIAPLLPDQSVNWEIPAPSDQFVDAVHHTSGHTSTIGCPEATACALGLHEDPQGSSHPEVIWFQTHLLTPEELRLCGIPQDWHGPYVLDTIDFRYAAHLLRKYPDLLQSQCPC